jgi:hypothetical protein
LLRPSFHLGKSDSWEQDMELDDTLDEAPPLLVSNDADDVPQLVHKTTEDAPILKVPITIVTGR